MVAKLARRATVFLRGSGAYGAGILLDDVGHILTCLHVIEGLGPIEVELADGSTYRATVVDRDGHLDAALLRTGARKAGPAAFASVMTVAAGDELFAMGAPRKLRFSFTRGMASYVGRPFEGVYYLQSDVALNGGSSGGPVLDRLGRVVAMSSFVVRDSEGLSFALPVDYALARFARHLQAAPPVEGATQGAFGRWLAAQRTSTATSRATSGESAVASSL